MTVMKADVEILREESKVRPMLETIIKVTNTNADALGFLPRAVYDEAMSRGRLWIVVDVRGTYQGHLLFGGVYPTMKIKQLFVAPTARRQGLAHSIIKEFVSYSEDQGYGSIRARVAVDLEANAAWERLGFHIQGIVDGGETTHRKLNVRYRRLMPGGRQLHMLKLLEAPPKALVGRGLPINRSHWYALDLNVWYDFYRRRDPYYAAARALIEAASRGSFRLRFTSEAKQEAERTRGDRDQDPLLVVATVWEAIPTGDSRQLVLLVDEMRELVFPDRSPQRREAAADTSDLRHLAMSVMAGATGFVTREKALLRHNRALRERYQLEVLEPGDLLDDLNEASSSMIFVADSLKIESLRERRDIAARFVGVSVSRPLSRLRALDVDDDGRVCFIGERLVGVVYWRRTPRGDNDVYLCLEIDGADEVARQRAFDVLLGALMSQEGPNGVARTLLTSAPETGVRFGDDLARCGFFPTSQPDVFVRFTVGQPGLFDSWSAAKKVVDSELGVDSEWLGDHDSLPVLRMRLPSGVHELDRFAFESRFGLTGMTLRCRRMVYIPILERYANELLPGTPRPSLLQEHDAALRFEHVYFRSPAAAGVVRQGDVLLFYQSSPISAIIGMARCTASVVLSHQEAGERFRRLAVLDPHSLGDRVHCIAFDNYLVFKQIVTRKWLAQQAALPTQEIISAIEVPSTLDPLQVLRQGAGQPK